MGRLEGKVTIITGAAKGLGEADARMFAREGARVVLTDVDVVSGQKVADEVGSSAHFIKHDVRDAGQWEKVVSETVSRFGSLNILVNNAGVVELGTIESQTLDQYDFIMDVSSKGTFLGCKYALPEMIKAGSGSIINMASLASVQGEPYVVAYSAAKGAVEAMTRSVAIHCAKSRYNIRCNSVHPSGILTPMVMSLDQKEEESDMDRIENDVNAARANELGEPDDIAHTVVFLASDESKFINGAQIRVDNGTSVTTGLI